MSPGDAGQPGVPDGLVRLSGDALAALAGLGRDDGAGVVTVAWAACEPHEPTYVAVGTSATPRFLTELDHLTGVVASVGVIGR